MSAIHGKLVLHILQDVAEMMAKKLGFADPEEDALSFALFESLDGITSELAV